MRPVDHVRHVRDLGERLEAVRAAGRHVEAHLLVVAQVEARPVPVRRRRRPQVDHHVEDRAGRAADQLGLAPAPAHVHPAYHAAHRAGLAVLDERSRIQPGRAHHVRVEGTAEEAALVHVRPGPEQQDTVDARNRTDVHPASPPAAAPMLARRGRDRGEEAREAGHLAVRAPVAGETDPRRGSGGLAGVVAGYASEFMAVQLTARQAFPRHLPGVQALDQDARALHLLSGLGRLCTGEDSLGARCSGRSSPEATGCGWSRPESPEALRLAGLATVPADEERGHGRNDAVHDRG